MANLNVGVIGCGRIAQFVHLRILRRLSGVRVVALAEADECRRTEASNRFPEARVFTDYHDLLALPELEAVFVCLPNALHVTAALAALDQGKHFYLEKPLAIHPDEARDLLNAWRNAALVGMIGFNYRFDPLMIKLQRHIQRRSIGEPIAVRSVFSTAARPLPPWKQKRRSGGGVLLDLASHHIDLLRFLFEEEVSEVVAILRSEQGEDDSATVQMRLNGGLLVQSFFSLNSAEEDRFEVYGSSGKLEMDRHLFMNIKVSGTDLDHARLKRLAHAFGSQIHSLDPRTKMRGPRYFCSYRSAFAHFINCVQNNEPASPDLWDGYRSLLVIQAAEESANTGRTTRVREP